MNNVLQRASKILKQPVAPDALSEPGKGAPRKFTATPSWEQAEAEAAEALATMAAERWAAQRSIATHGERREALLLDPDSDDAILRLGIEIDRANTALQRLDVVQPQLAQRLGEIRTLARADRMAKFAARWADQMAKYQDIEAQYQAAREAWQADADRCEAEFFEQVYTTHQHNAPNFRDVIPHPAPLRPYTETFAEQLERFRNLTLVPRQPEQPLFRSLASFIEVARVTGSVPADTPLAWLPDVERALRPTVKIELLADWIDPDGIHHKKGRIIELPPEVAEKRVTQGRAFYVRM